MKFISKTSFVATAEELVASKFIESPDQLHCELCFQTGEKYTKKWFVYYPGTEDELIICQGCLDNIQENMK